MLRSACHASCRHAAATEVQMGESGQVAESKHSVHLLTALTSLNAVAEVERRQSVKTRVLSAVRLRSGHWSDTVSESRRRR